MPDIDGNLEQAAAEEAAYPSPDRSLAPHHLSSRRIKAFALISSESVLLDVEAQSEEWRKGVRQVQEHGRRDYADEAEVVRYGCCDDKGNNPPDWNDSSIENFAPPGDEWRCAEDVQEDVVVEHFDADVAVKPCSDEGGDQGNHVTRGLPAIDADALVARIEAVLTLEVIDVASINEVHAVDEELRSPHGFDKVTRPLHLSQELHKKLSASIRQHARQQAVD